MTQLIKTLSDTFQHLFYLQLLFLVIVFFPTVESLTCETCDFKILGYCMHTDPVNCTGSQTNCFTGVASKRNTQNFLWHSYRGTMKKITFWFLTTVIRLSTEFVHCVKKQFRLFVKVSSVGTYFFLYFISLTCATKNTF